MENIIHSTVDKGVIANLSFTKKDKYKKATGLYEKLKSAAILGNIYHSKVTIYFHDDEGPKKTTTTIWATCKDYISLKGGVWIPVSKITDVEYNF